jgi:ABC-type multidrug transport system fused ATPase/permease subunit
MTNEAYVNRNFHGIVVIGLIAMVIFIVKGFATYGSAVMLSWIGNRIIADNQRRMFDKLLQQNIGFFADRHSSEFIARLTTGANAVSQVINLLITAIGRDLMSLIGLSIVMVVQDPVMSLAGFLMPRRRRSFSCASSSAGCAASPACSSPAAPASSRPCRRRCKACAWSRPSAGRRDAAAARQERR